MGARGSLLMGTPSWEGGEGYAAFALLFSFDKIAGYIGDSAGDHIQIKEFGKVKILQSILWRYYLDQVTDNTGSSLTIWIMQAATRVF